MEKLAGYLLSAVLLAAGFISVSAQEEVKYVKNGDTLTVKPSHVSGKITSITWKHNGDFVAEWMDKTVELTYYGQFKDRTTMDITTGSLEIRNMGPVDSGMFVVEINNNVQSKTYNVKVIQPVPKPDVSHPPECNTESENCTLGCEGNAGGAEPVTYSWNLGGEWKNGGKDQTIDKTTCTVKEFRCWMKNPISEETSEPKRNPLYCKNPVIIISSVLGGLVAAVFVSVCGVLGWRYYNKQRGNAVVSSNNRPPLADDANRDKPSEVKELMDTNSRAAEEHATESG